MPEDVLKSMSKRAKGEKNTSAQHVNKGLREILLTQNLKFHK